LVLSVGSSKWVKGKTADDIMNEADKEMYAVKARGKEGRAAQG